MIHPCSLTVYSWKHRAHYEQGAPQTARTTDRAFHVHGTYGTGRTRDRLHMRQGAPQTGHTLDRAHTGQDGPRTGHRRDRAHHGKGASRTGHTMGQGALWDRAHHGQGTLWTGHTTGQDSHAIHQQSIINLQTCSHLVENHADSARKCSLIKTISLEVSSHSAIYCSLSTPHPPQIYKKKLKYKVY